MKCDSYSGRDIMTNHPLPFSPSAPIPTKINQVCNSYRDPLLSLYLVCSSLRLVVVVKDMLDSVFDFRFRLACITGVVTQTARMDFAWHSRPTRDRGKFLFR